MAALSVIVVAVALERYALYRKCRIAAFADIKSLELVLTAKLSVIRLGGQQCPLPGLLGTVLGIMLTFYNMGQDAAMDTGRIDRPGPCPEIDGRRACGSAYRGRDLQRASGKVRVLMLKWEIAGMDRKTL